MVAPTAVGLVTVEEFMALTERPENAGRWLELDRGRVIEMPPPGRPHGTACSWITHLLWVYALRVGGEVTSNDTAILVSRDPDTVRGADVMLFLNVGPRDTVPAGPVTDVPELVVEVHSPSDRPGLLTRRVNDYRKRGVPLVWVVYPEERTVDVYRSGAATVDLGESDELFFPDVLPGFRCRVIDLFTRPTPPPVA